MARRRLRLIGHITPDWFLMDIKMKEMDGLKINAAFPNARIVIVTGYDDTRLREAADRAGACAYVNKKSARVAPKSDRLNLRKPR